MSGWGSMPWEISTHPVFRSQSAETYHRAMTAMKCPSSTPAQLAVQESLWAQYHRCLVVVELVQALGGPLAKVLDRERAAREVSLAVDLGERIGERAVGRDAVAVFVGVLALAARLDEYRQVRSVMLELPAHTVVTGTLETTQRYRSAEAMHDPALAGVGGPVARVPNVAPAALEVAWHPHLGLRVPLERA